MKNLGTVFKFEFFTILNKKAFKVSTIILSLIIIIALKIPYIANVVGKPLFDKENGEIKSEVTEEKIKYGITIKDKSINLSDLKEEMKENELVAVKSVEELKEKVLSNEIEAGFLIKSPLKYNYIVKDTSISKSNNELFESVLLKLYREKSIENKGINYEQVEEIYNKSIDSEIQILGKDGIKNYFYTYIFIIGLYLIVLFYGQMIATSVASEKSNRSMEILVTSTSTRSLIFGKVFAGALAGLTQFITILLVALLTYKLNLKAWNNTIDFLFDVPINVLVTFSLFGTLGYLLFLFIYSVVGALVSRTEDISSSSMPVMILFMVGFFISIIGLNNPDTILMKVASFFPFTSFMAMFARVSMGSVPKVQIIVSFIVLLITTIATGVLSSRIYRLGTLMYGNPIKISRAFKMLRNK